MCTSAEYDAMVRGKAGRNLDGPGFHKKLLILTAKLVYDYLKDEQFSDGPILDMDFLLKQIRHVQCFKELEYLQTKDVLMIYCEKNKVTPCNF